MNDLVKSTIFGTATLVFLFVGAYFTNEVGETESEKALNMKNKVEKVVVDNDVTKAENINSKNSEVSL